MNVVKEIERINELELQHGLVGGSSGSWHHKYRNSAWVYVGGLSYELTEGDVICVMSQWGEIEDINLVREKDTNKSQGFAFVKYEDQRSTILAVDNFNGIKLLGRTLRCDHVETYKLPKDVREKEEALLEEDPTAHVSIGPGHAYRSQDLSNEFNISAGIDLWSKPGTSSQREEEPSRKSKHKKEKKEKKHKKEKRRRDSEEGSDRGREDLRRDDNRDATVFERVRGREAIDRAAVVADSSASASWRGRMEPALQAHMEAERRKADQTQSGSDRRDEFDGFGGMKRRR